MTATLRMPAWRPPGRPAAPPSRRRRAMLLSAGLALLLPLLTVAGAMARAQGVDSPAGTLTLVSGDLRAVELRRGAAAAAAPLATVPVALQARDRVTLRDAATRVRIDLPWRPGDPVLLHGPGAAFTVPPLPETGMPTAWHTSYQHFWQAAAGSVLLSRGVRLPGGAGGALRPMDGLPLDGARILAGPGGLVLAWAGGLPPFAVAVATEDGREIAQAAGLERRQARFDSLVVPAAPALVVTLRDSEGQGMTARLRPESRLPPGFPAAAAAAAPVAHAIALYEEAGPEWRLEALRRLLARADRDHLAATALRQILEGAL